MDDTGAGGVPCPCILSMKVVAIVPAYNEAPRVRQALQNLRPHVAEIVVVDDASKDGTSEQVRGTGAILLRHPVNRGQGAALRTGTEYALRYLQPDIVVHFDADGQMQPSDIAAVTAPIMRGDADVVIGSRFLGKKAENMPWQRRLTLVGARVFMTALTGLRLSDMQSGFRALSTKAAAELEITLDRMAHASEILDLIAARRMRVAEVPVTIVYTAETLAKGQEGRPSFFAALRIVTDLVKKRLVG